MAGASVAFSLSGPTGWEAAAAADGPCSCCGSAVGAVISGSDDRCDCGVWVLSGLVSCPMSETANQSPAIPAAMYGHRRLGWVGCVGVAGEGLAGGR